MPAAAIESSLQTRRREIGRYGRLRRLKLGGRINAMREADRPIGERVSVLERPAADGDSPPEDSVSMLGDAELSSFRLALVDDDRRVYIGRHGEDGLFLLLLDAAAGGGSGSHRSTLTERGAIVMWNSVQGGRFIVAGIVADPVTAVRVGEIPAALHDNAFAAVVPRGASDVVTVATPDGERQVPLPPLVL